MKLGVLRYERKRSGSLEIALIGSVFFNRAVPLYEKPQALVQSTQRTVDV